MPVLLAVRSMGHSSPFNLSKSQFFALSPLSSHRFISPMCQGSTPDHFEFKQSPPELPPGWLRSRFLDQLTEPASGTAPAEYTVSKTAPCPIIDAHVHGTDGPCLSVLRCSLSLSRLKTLSHPLTHRFAPLSVPSEIDGCRLELLRQLLLACSLQGDLPREPSRLPDRSGDSPCCALGASPGDMILSTLQ